MTRDIINRLFGGPQSDVGPLKPRPKTPGLHYPPGAYVPDYKIYKLEDAPELVNVEKRLAARGLKSPWLRNEIWRYSRKEWGTESWRIASLVTFGWKWAIPMLALTAIYEYAIKNSHEHHDLSKHH